MTATTIVSMNSKILHCFVFVSITSLLYKAINRVS